jgi:polyhydroxyalkanoate synthesis regulator phasin
MSNPVVQAFFLGRAAAEVLSEQFEATMTNALSDLGKFDAEQRERLRQFTEDVVERAKQAEGDAMSDRPSPSTNAAEPSTVATQDLQTMLDEMRAEIAQLRSALQRYRNPSA